jgi:hypothetical protein
MTSVVTQEGGLQLEKIYTDQEKKQILEELGIHPLGGMLNSRQVAQVWTKRSEIEFGKRHEYDDNSVRWRVKSKARSLKPALSIHSRTNLFNIDDAFTVKLEPGRGRKRKLADVPRDEAA